MTVRKHLRFGVAFVSSSENWSHLSDETLFWKVPEITVSVASLKAPVSARGHIVFRQSFCFAIRCSKKGFANYKFNYLFYSRFAIGS